MSYTVHHLIADLRVACEGKHYHDPCRIVVGRMRELLAEIERLRAELARAREERDEWKARTGREGTSWCELGEHWFFATDPAAAARSPDGCAGTTSTAVLLCATCWRRWIVTDPTPATPPPADAMFGSKGFTSGRPFIVTADDVRAPWSGHRDGRWFRCGLCGHRFRPGDVARWLYTNNMPGPCQGNPFVCHGCDGGDVRERWAAFCAEAHSPRFWWFMEGRNAR